MKSLQVLWLCCWATLIAAPTIRAVGAAEIPIVNEPVAIAPGESKSFEFGTVPQVGTTTLLKITSRLDSKGLGGSMFFLKLTLNGKEVQAAKSRTAIRLVNKPLVSPVAPEIPTSWFGSPLGWRVLYAPDFEAALAQKFYADNPYDLVLDVTDLTNPAAENRLEITNTATPSAKKWAETNADLIIGKMSVETREGASPMMASSVSAAPVINRGTPAAGAAKYAAKVLAGGGIEMQVGGQTYQFSSAFSFPDAGFNTFPASTLKPSAGANNWRVTTTKDGARGEGNDYAVARTVKITPRRIEISDAITNKRAEALGLVVRNEMILQNLKNPIVRLAGNPDPATNDYYAPGNPSVHVTIPGGAIAMICEDDVFRNQALLYTSEAQNDTPAVMGLRSEMLRLSPRETYTLKWAIYPVAGLDYFDFLNLVREDWGANYTVDGAWWWGYHVDTVLKMPDEELRHIIQTHGYRYLIVGGGWLDFTKDKKRIGFGTGVFDDYWDDYRRRVRESAEKIRRVVPGTKVLVYYDSQRDTSQGSSPEGQIKFRDSWLTDTKGNQIFTDWSNTFSRTFSVVATTQNSYGKAMLEAADRYMDEMKLDGIYWDEMENVSFGTPLLTHNQFDGHSCFIDPTTFRITREVGITTLLGEAHRLEVIRRVRAKDAPAGGKGVVLGNGPTTTLDLLNTRIQRMTEIQHNDAWAYEGLLDTPLGYISSYNKWETVRRAFSFGSLPVPIHIAKQELPIYARLFPFTPIELHSGYLLGRERIIANHSGNYGWINSRDLVRVHHFDNTGKPTGKTFPTTITHEARTKVDLAENESVVLERLPLTLSAYANTKNFRAEVSKIEYSPQQVLFTVNAPQGAFLTLRDDEFNLPPATSAKVQLGTAAARAVTIAYSSLLIELPQGFDGTVKITR